MWEDLAAERAATVPYPPGEHRFSMRRTNRIMDDPLRTLVDAYERHGPIFTLRIFHHNVVFMLGPEANHHVLVSGAANMSWRDGELRSLVPFLGDIDQHPEMAVAVSAQVVREPREFLGAHLENALRPQLPALPDMGRQALGVEVKEAAGDHVLILLMTS